MIKQINTKISLSKKSSISRRGRNKVIVRLQNNKFSNYKLLKARINYHRRKFGNNYSDISTQKARNDLYSKLGYRVKNNESGTFVYNNNNELIDKWPASPKESRNYVYKRANMYEKAGYKVLKSRRGVRVYNKEGKLIDSWNYIYKDLNKETSARRVTTFKSFKKIWKKN